MTVEFKAFTKILLLLQEDGKEAKRNWKDKRLTVNERKILMAWEDLKKCKHSEALNLVQVIPEDAEDLIGAQAFLVRGIAHNNSGKYLKAKECLKRSCDFMRKTSYPELTFVAFYNYFVTVYNLGDLTEMSKCISSLLKIKTALRRQQICLKQCEMSYAIYTNHPAAEKFIKELDRCLSEMSPPMVMNHLIASFMYWVKISNFQMAWDTLDLMKDHRLFRFSPNYIFMKTLLDHLVDDGPIYVYQSKFEGCEILYYQLKTIQALEEDDEFLAREYWDKLRGLDPRSFQKPFLYHGQKCLFSLCLEKHQKKAHDEILQISSQSDKVESFVNILMTSKVPVNKIKIFTILFGYAPANIQDDNKLRNLLLKVRSQYPNRVSYKKGCYYWVDSEEKAG